jgi:hypothetical protein
VSFNNHAVTGIVYNNATYYGGNYVYDTVYGNSSAHVVSLNLGTGASTSTLVSGLTVSAYGDIASNTSGEIWAWSNSGKEQEYNLLSPTTTATTFSATAPEDLQIAFDQNGSLFGLGIDGKLYSINTSSGVDTPDLSQIVWDDHGHNVTLTGFEDAASAAPVPEPMTMGLGLAGVGLFVRRRMRSK